MRNSVRGQSPRQRDFTLQAALNRQLDNADFTGLDLTPADDLSIPLRLSAQIETPAAPNPRPGFDVESYFAPPARDRPLLLNNGQPLHLTQTVELTYDHGDPAQAPSPFDATVGGLHARTAWVRVGDHAWRRTAELDVTAPLVGQADYAGVRHLLREWIAQLAP